MSIPLLIARDGTSAVADAPPFVTTPSQERLPRLPRLGFLGVGRSGRQRLAALATSGTAAVEVIADACLAHARAASRLVPGARIGRSLADVLDEDLDGVVIDSPSEVRADQAVAAIERGLSVFCGQPLGRTKHEARRVVDAARNANRLLRVEACHRHLVAASALRRLIVSGDLGPIENVDAVFHATAPTDPEPDEQGCLIGPGAQIIDLAFWLLDVPGIDHVRGHRYAGGRRLGPTDATPEDCATGIVQLSSGTTMSLACSWHAPAGVACLFRLTINGRDGCAVLENVAGSCHDFRAIRCHDGQQPARVLSSTADVLGGRAAMAWAYRLSTDRSFDPEAERAVAVASVLDRLYR